MRDRNLVEYTQLLYETGIRKYEIARKLNQSTSNISRWCRKSSAQNLLKNPTTYQEKQRVYWYGYEKTDLETLSKEKAKILLSLLYWCEGAKYPGTNRIEFVSSDENMQVAFIKLMRIAFSEEIIESKFRVMLQLHTTHNIKQSIQYWSRLLSIPETQFIKPSITIGKSSRYRHIYNGTCGLRYHDYRLLLRIMGMYDQLAEQINK